MIVSPLEWLAAFTIVFVAGVIFGKISNYSRMAVRHA